MQIWSVVQLLQSAWLICYQVTKNPGGIVVYRFQEESGLQIFNDIDASHLWNPNFIETD